MMGVGWRSKRVPLPPRRSAKQQPSGAPLEELFAPPPIETPVPKVETPDEIAAPSVIGGPGGDFMFR